MTIYELGKNGLREVRETERSSNLKRGDVIHWGGNQGYPAEDLVILERFLGFGDRIAYKVVNLRHIYQKLDEYIPHIRQIEAYSIRDKKDPTIWHSQHHFYTDRTVAEEGIQEILDFIPVAKRREERKEEEKIRKIHEAGQLTRGEKIRLSTKEIAKLIRDKLKKKFPKCKFSVTKKSYSGGSSISVDLLSAPFEVFREYSSLSERAIDRYLDGGRRTTEEIKSLCAEKYAQLSQYGFKEYDPDVWNNGHFLTEKAYDVLKEVVDIVNYYNYDNSDIQTDYFDVNFYFHLGIGRWDRPFVKS